MGRECRTSRSKTIKPLEEEQFLMTIEIITYLPQFRINVRYVRINQNLELSFCNLNPLTSITISLS